MLRQTFIEKSHQKHGDRYNYSQLVDEFRYSDKVSIVCKQHGQFVQRVADHIRGAGCPACKKERLRSLRLKSLDQFIEDARLIHGNKYDYSNSVYVGDSQPIAIFCRTHGPFTQTATSHLQGCGCPKCAHVVSATALTLSSKRRALGFSKFAVRANAVHANKYQYVPNSYQSICKPVTVICPLHGEFQVRAQNHVSGDGCAKCANDAHRKSLEQFIIDACAIHGNKYDYSQVVYKDSHTYVAIMCPHHGVFKQKPYVHISCRCGCPKCKESRGEKSIRQFLEQHNIQYIAEHTFNGCVSPGGMRLRFDFWLPAHNTCVEFDGEQHFAANHFWGGADALQRTKQRDQIKNQYCQQHNIQLLRIDYTKYDQVCQILTACLLKGSTC